MGVSKKNLDTPIFVGNDAGNDTQTTVYSA